MTMAMMKEIIRLRLPMFGNVEATGEATWNKQWLLVLDRVSGMAHFESYSFLLWNAEIIKRNRLTWHTTQKYSILPFSDSIFTSGHRQKLSTTSRNYSGFCFEVCSKASTKHHSETMKTHGAQRQLWVGSPPGFDEVLLKALSSDPTQRPRPSEILEAQWFKDQAGHPSGRHEAQETWTTDSTWFYGLFGLLYWESFCLGIFWS